MLCAHYSLMRAARYPAASSAARICASSTFDGSKRTRTRFRHSLSLTASTPGLAIAVLAIPVMWWLARAKIRVADQIGSRALRADAVESITCGYLSGVVVLGLIAQLLMPGWWWVDRVASLAIVALLAKEGREAWEGEESAKEE